MSPLTTIDSAERARDELAKIYGAGVRTFARLNNYERFPCEVGYITHSGRGVVRVVVGRGASWANALDNAERKINRVERQRLGEHQKPRKKGSGKTRGFPQAGDLFGGAS